jgi:polysaccharide export outer membrane protein
MRGIILTIATALGLAGCGVVYQSPQVSEGVTESGVSVTVVPLNTATAAQANNVNTYQPRSLPAALRSGTYNAPKRRPPQPVLQQEVRKSIVTTWPEPLKAEPYRLGVGDLLLFAPPASDASNPLATGSLDAASARRQEYAVQDDGSIVVPDIGRIRVAGLTLEAIEQEMFDALLENQKEPTFSLEISKFNSQRVDVSGRVKSPQVLPITLNPMYLREAIAIAGGTSVEDQDNVVVKLYRDGQEYQMLLSEVFSESTLGRQLLTDGDAVFVDTVFSKQQAEAYFNQQVRLYELETRSQQSALDNARKDALQKLELGAIERDYVYLVGEVRKQQRFELPFEHNANLADILFSDNAIEIEKGDFSQIYLLRPSTGGAIIAYHLDASNIGNIALAAKIDLQADDFVFVAEQKITRWNRVISQSVPSLINTVAASAR